MVGRTDQTHPSVVTPESWNGLVERIEDLEKLILEGRTESPMARHNVGWIDAVNNTNVPFTGDCEIVGIGPPLVLPTDNLREFKTHNSHSVIRPQKCCRVGVVFKPAPIGKFTCVVVSGVWSARVDVRQDDLLANWKCRANPIDGTISHLVSASDGGITVLWTESQNALGQPTVAGVQYARVLVGNPATCSESEVETQDCPYCTVDSPDPAVLTVSGVVATGPLFAQRATWANAAHNMPRLLCSPPSLSCCEFEQTPPVALPDTTGNLINFSATVTANGWVARFEVDGGPVVSFTFNESVPFDCSGQRQLTPSANIAGGLDWTNATITIN